jgi:hypothetical protein
MPLQQWLLLETVFSIWSMDSGYKEDNWGDQVSSESKVRLRRDDFMCAVATIRLVIISVLKYIARIQPVKTETVLVICKARKSAIAL